MSKPKSLNKNVKKGRVGGTDSLAATATGGTIPATRETITDFGNRVDDLTRQGYEPLLPPSVYQTHSGEVPNEATTSAELLQKSSCIGGPAMTTAAGMFDSGQRTAVPVENAGTKGLGYIPWGPADNLPNIIYKMAAALPYTAAAMKHNIEVAVGYGPALMYPTTRISNGALIEDLVPYANAGKLLREQIREVRERIREREREESARQQGGGEPPQGSTVTWAQATAPSASGEANPLPGTDEYELKILLDDYARWEKTNGEWRRFCEDNHLLMHYISCMTDAAHMGIYFPTIGLSIGREGEWNPKIVSIDVKSSLIMRMEQMDNNGVVNYIYKSERWRGGANSSDPNSMKITALPALMPYNFLSKLRNQVNTANRLNLPVNSRRRWFCTPVYYPNMQNPYYPQQAWWSIFPSKVYDYAATLITDKAIERQNGTMWGKMIFVHTDYIRALCDEQGADTPEKISAVRSKLFKDINSFLKRRENNGKTFMADMFTDMQGKNTIKGVEIVDVPTVTNAQEMKVEVEEIANIILFAAGTRADLIGASLGKSSNGGTFQRELFLLEQSKKAGIQRLYTRWLTDIYTFNEWDPKGIIVIRQPVLTTLDREPTGIADNTNS